MNKYFIIKDNVVTNIVTSDNVPQTKESEIAVLKTIGGVRIGDIHNPDTNTFSLPLKGGFSIEKDSLEIEDKLYVGASNVVQVVLRHNYPINTLLTSDFTLSNATINDVITNNLKTLINITIDDTYISSNSIDPIVLSLNKNITSLTQNLQAKIHPISFYFSSTHFETIPGDELPSE